MNARGVYEVYDYGSYDLTKVPLNGQIRYFTGVKTGQIEKVYVVGDNSKRIDQLPFENELLIMTTANIDLENIRIQGNRVKIHNTGTAALTVQTNVTGSEVYEYINAGDTVKAFFDGSAWQVDDGMPNGYIMPFHKSFGSRTRNIPWGYIELSGGTISDPGSQDNGETTEDLNGDKRFLRGGSVSGTIEADAFQGFLIQTSENTNPDSGSGNNRASVGRRTSGNFTFTHPFTFVTDGVNGTPRIADETRPVNMSVVWIMKK